jgi:cytochrome c5
MHAFLILVALVAAGCSRPAPEQPKPTPPTASTAASKVDLDKIFPAGAGRQLVLDNCTTCHTFVPIVVLRMTKDAWQRNSRDHRERVKALSDADFTTLYEYLAANFNPDRPVPELPNELMQTWTSY